MDNTLAGYIKEVIKPVFPTVPVDLTPFFKVPEGEKRVFEWRNPSVAEAYRIGNDARELLKKYRHWPEQLALDVATVAACHVGPSTGGLAPGLFYALIADSPNDKLWYEILRRLGQEFPHLKGTTLPLVDELLDLCVTYLHRHPDELSHLSSETMFELERMAARRTAETGL